MIVQTKHFGEIELDAEKVITFNHGLMGFEEFKKYTLLFDLDDNEEDRGPISWLQSVEEPALAIPVISPFAVKSDYSPVIEDELLVELGEIADENLVVLLTMTVPEDITQVSVNLKAPIVINASNRKAMQIIVENKEYQVKHNIYQDIQRLKEDKGEN